MKIGYEESKCVCCGKVYVNSFLMDVSGNDGLDHCIVCLDCASNIHKYIESIKKLTK
jgi:hypothetical protein